MQSHLSDSTDLGYFSNISLYYEGEKSFLIMNLIICSLQLKSKNGQEF